MINSSDIKNLFIEEYKKHNIKDTGYACKNGNQYIELRNIIFKVDNNYIFEDAKQYDSDYMTDDWYNINYEPILTHDNQFQNCIYKLIKNPNSRQAVLLMGETTEYYHPDYFICTMYMHIFLDKNDNNTYNMQYIVHMRSNDAVEFGNDIKWHKTVIDRIKEKLSKYYNIINIEIIWNADSFQLYEKFFNLVNTY